VDHGRAGPQDPLRRQSQAHAVVGLRRRPPDHDRAFVIVEHVPVHHAGALHQPLHHPIRALPVRATAGDVLAALAHDRQGSMPTRSRQVVDVRVQNCWSSRSHDVELTAGPWSVGESLVGRSEGATQGFGERDVARVVRGGVVSQLPSTAQEWCGRVDGDGKVQQIFDRVVRLCWGECTARELTADDRDGLDSEEIWCRK